jgi:hypothetical protein
MIPNLFVILFALASAPSGEGKVEVPYLLGTTDSAAITAGVGLLRESSIRPRTVEIRVWMGFGTTMPDSMLRLDVDEKGVAHGEVLVHYSNDFTGWQPADVTAFERSIQKKCSKVRHGQGTVTCVGEFKKSPDWTLLYQRVNRLGIATLPDESALPKTKDVVRDGSCMVVEVRNDSGYRTYEYCNPGRRKGPEADAAIKIMREIGPILGSFESTS